MCCVCARNGMCNWESDLPFALAPVWRAVQDSMQCATGMNRGVTLRCHCTHWGWGRALGKPCLALNTQHRLHATCSPRAAGSRSPKRNSPFPQGVCRWGAPTGATQQRRPTGCMHTGNNYTIQSLRVSYLFYPGAAVGHVLCMCPQWEGATASARLPEFCTSACVV
jgi:hypothetical protein